MKTVTYNGVSGFLMPMTLKRMWFDKILAGEKKIEYRSGSDYWINRLRRGNLPKFIRFANGYSKDARAFTIEVIGVNAMIDDVDFEDIMDRDTFEHEFSDETIAVDSEEYENGIAPSWFEIKLGRIVKKENM